MIPDARNAAMNWKQGMTPIEIRLGFTITFTMKPYLAGAFILLCAAALHVAYFGCESADSIVCWIIFLKVAIGVYLIAITNGYRIASRYPCDRSELYTHDSNDR